MSEETTLEIAVELIEKILIADYPVSKRAISLLLLQEDREIEGLVKQKEPQDFPQIQEIISRTKESYSQPLSFLISLRRQEEANQICQRVMRFSEKNKFSLKEKFSQILMNPFMGGPILLIILYYGLYKFVGDFGAGVVVNFLEVKVFEQIINPALTKFFTAIIPFKIIQELLVGEYGVLTLGVRYAVAIILPIVTIFFLVFAVIEDSGYLPRLAMLIDQLFKKIGLSGRAVIPMVLGFGCDTMATMVTRTLPTKRERIIATLLLALAVPCSAQLGVIMALLGGRPLAMFIWIIVISLVFLFVGVLSSWIIPGEMPSFYMEIPPLRWPQVSNVLRKTYSRVRWYIKEVFPIFIFASFLIWLGELVGIFNILVGFLKFPVRLIGLPDKAAEIFLFGFFRRDYGAAGLYDLNKQGLLTGRQLVVACVALTLFLPCIAQLLMNIKERGIKTGAYISLFILFISFFVAYILNSILEFFNVVIK
ncbi:MAG: ferrous iron transporter B [Candidatus Omnitrophota bacterium]|nr:ferrous iron transporter B [Candidatus Omnitrophota bacterium]